MADITYHNLRELIINRAGEDTSPGHWGKLLYKYTDCGPWVVFLLDDDSEVYYEDEAAWKADDWIDRCVGIKIGSIVEGSEVTIGPEELLFPFKEKTLDEVIDNINEEAIFYWKRDNTTYYSIRKKDDPDNVVMYCQWEDGDDDPEGTFDAKNDDEVALARAAGEALFEDMYWDNKVIDFPGHPDLCVKVEETPDYTF